MWRVEINGLIVGFIEKYMDTRTEKNPYKAFLGVGANNQYLDGVYPASHRASDLAGAREAAVDLILAELEKAGLDFSAISK